MRNLTNRSARMFLLRLAERNNVIRGGPVDQRHDLVGDGFHDRLIFDSIFVLVVHVGNSAFLVILNSIHRITAETKTSDGAAVSPSQIMRHCSFNF